MNTFWRCVLLVLLALGAVAGYRLVDGAQIRPGPAAVVKFGTSPWPALEGAMFLDTDASTNGTLVVYKNGDWRTVAVLP